MSEDGIKTYITTGQIKGSVAYFMNSSNEVRIANEWCLDLAKYTYRRIIEITYVASTIPNCKDAVVDFINNEDVVHNENIIYKLVMSYNNLNVFRRDNTVKNLKMLEELMKELYYKEE